MSIPASLFYPSIIGDPNYRNFEFQPNWIFYSICAMIVYNIPPIFIFFKITFFLYTRKSENKKTGIRLEICYSFLLMQFWNIMLILADFGMLRIGPSTILTRYCATENPQAMLKTIVFFYFWANYSAQMFTVLFCALRVAVMYSVAQETSEKIIKFVPPIIVTFGFIAALLHLFTAGDCLQLGDPMLLGSIAILTKFHSENLSVPYLNLGFYFSVTITVAVLNILMLMKVRRKTSSGASTSRVTKQNAKVEKTLTGTMIILVVPMVVSLFIPIGEILRNQYFPYILIIRPFFLDARVHIVTCYFYLTHPIFKESSPQSSVSIMSRAT